MFDRTKNAGFSEQLDLLWFCQLAADGEFIGTAPARRPTLSYISSLVETAAEMGFSSLLTATNFHAEHEAWTASIATLARTRGAGLLIAVRPGMFHPAIFAKMVATAANLFPGRVRINVVTGSNPAENAMYGDMESHAERYARTREFIAVMRDLWSGEPVDHDSERYPFRGAIVSPIPADPVPIYLGGHSEEAQAIAAELADVYLVWGDTLKGIEGRLTTMREQEARVPRRVDAPLRYGLRCHVVVRETEDEAWKAADRLISRIDPEVRRRFIEASAAVDSEGQRRQAALSSSSTLVVEPPLGRRRLGAQWRRRGDRRRSVASGGEAPRLSDARHQHFHSVRLSASRGVSPVRRDGDAAAQSARAARPDASGSGVVCRCGAGDVSR